MSSYENWRAMAKTSKYRYEIILYWSDEDQAYIAEVPQLPGCAADGATYQEAIEAVEDVIEGWIETALEMGRSIPEPKRRSVRAYRPTLRRKSEKVSG